MIRNLSFLFILAACAPRPIFDSSKTVENSRSKEKEALAPIVLEQGQATSSYCSPVEPNLLSSPGSHQVETENIGSFTIYYPKSIATEECKRITLAWGNGTGRVGGAAYSSLHQHWASHGIVVVVSHSGSTGNGSPIRQGIDLISEESKKPSSKFYNKIADSFAVSGQSQGGLGASSASSDPRVSVVIAMGGAGITAAKPGLFITGSGDFMKTSVDSAYARATDNSLYLSTSGTSHPQVPFTVASKVVSIAWLQCFISDDQASCKEVKDDCAMCKKLGISDIKGK